MKSATFELSEANAPAIWDGFNQFYDALATSIAYKTNGVERTLTIELLVIDKQLNTKRTVMVVAINPSEVRLHECRTCVTVLSEGLQFRKFNDDLYLAISPYCEEMDSVEEFRKSDFYFAAQKVIIQS